MKKYLLGADAGEAQLRPPKDADFQVWRQRGRDCARCWWVCMKVKELAVCILSEIRNRDWSGFPWDSAGASSWSLKMHWGRDKQGLSLLYWERESTVKLGEWLLQEMKALSVYLICCLGSLAACQELRFGMLQRVLKLVQPWDYYLWCFSTWDQWYSRHSMPIPECVSTTWPHAKTIGTQICPQSCWKGARISEVSTLCEVTQFKCVWQQGFGMYNCQGPLGRLRIISRKRWDHLQKWGEYIFADRLRDLHDLTRDTWKKWKAEWYHVRGGTSYKVGEQEKLMDPENTGIVLGKWKK